MSEIEKENQQPILEQEDHTPPPEDPTQVLSPRRRSALVAYLAVLFAVAFLFVAITLAFEIKRLQLSNDTSAQTNASLYNNIFSLQEENQRLQHVITALETEKEDLTEQVAELESAVTEAAEVQQTLEESIASLNEETISLKNEKKNLETEVKELKQKAQDAVTVSELLQKAIAANDSGDHDGLTEICKQIEVLKSLLSASELEIYESLKID